jgi:hypothetical protein
MLHFSAPEGIAVSGSGAALSESLGAGRAVALSGKTGGRRPNGHQSNIGAGLVSMHRVRNAATVIGVALLASVLLFRRWQRSISLRLSPVMRRLATTRVGDHRHRPWPSTC